MPQRNRRGDAHCHPNLTELSQISPIMISISVRENARQDWTAASFADALSFRAGPTASKGASIHGTA